MPLLRHMHTVTSIMYVMSILIFLESMAIHVGLSWARNAKLTSHFPNQPFERISFEFLMSASPGIKMKICLELVANPRYKFCSPDYDSNQPGYPNFRFQSHYAADKVSSVT